MEKDSHLISKEHYIAAVSREMKSPLEKIVSLISSTESSIDERSVEIKDAARYLLSLVDELSSFTGELREPRP